MEQILPSHISHNDGELLKYHVRKQGIRIEAVVELLELSNKTHWYYYVNQQKIKRETLERFWHKLLLTEDEFYTAEAVKEIEAKPTTHEGHNLQHTIKAKGIKITYLAKRMGISRPTLYEYFEMNKLPLSVILEASHILEIEPVQLKGYNNVPTENLKLFEDMFKKFDERLTALENKVYN